jgi:ArsR family transcriptional regulator, arsenate/arsenite/antimonite-responsive transcriptional repressor / arsenate reductase (thioredoxin)
LTDVDGHQAATDPALPPPPGHRRRAFHRPLTIDHAAPLTILVLHLDALSRGLRPCIDLNCINSGLYVFSMRSIEPPIVLGLLADPVRWRLVEELGRSDRRVNELVEIIGKSQNLVSYHLAECRNAGIVSARRSSADRRDVYYRADLLRCRDLLAEVGLALHPALSLAPNGVVSRRARHRLLFLCTGNSSRSQIAEAFVTHRSAGTVEARSAGSHPKPLHPNSVRVMAEHGIDISSNEAKPLSRYSRSRFDRIITLCDKVREVRLEFPGSPSTAHWSTPDPATEAESDGTSYSAFQRVAVEIDERVTLLLADLRARAIRTPEPGDKPS